MSEEWQERVAGGLRQAVEAFHSKPHEGDPPARKIRHYKLHIRLLKLLEDFEKYSGIDPRGSSR